MPSRHPETDFRARTEHKHLNTPESLKRLKSVVLGATQHVNYLGLDNHIHELWWDNNGWHHNDLTAITGSPESIAAGPGPVGYVFSGTQHVNYLGADNHIQELWWDSGGWHHSDLTSAVGAAGTVYAEPRGYGFETHGTQHVIYMDDNGHVAELYWTP